MSTLETMLTELIEVYGLLALKAGTEWEDMNYGEIATLHALHQGEIPIFVKVAGPEAKTDLRHLREMGVDGILGPMIESEYALEKFVTTTQQAYAGSEIDLKIAINIETIQGYNNLDAILNSPYFADVDTVIIGRLDLSLSMRIDDVDRPEVVQVTQDLASRARRAGKHVSIGGFVNPSSASTIKEEMEADRLNTIHTMFDLTQVTDASTSVRKGIEFEIAYYQSLIAANPERQAFYQGRIATSQAKLDKANAPVPVAK